jgi:hypothetical protein
LTIGRLIRGAGRIEGLDTTGGPKLSLDRSSVVIVGVVYRIRARDLDAVEVVAVLIAKEPLPRILVTVRTGIEIEQVATTGAANAQ